MRFNLVRAGGVVLIVASLGLLFARQPDLHGRIDQGGAALDELLETRSVQIDPAELVDLMHNNQIRLLLLDVRGEADFNLFHLLDAKNIGDEELHGELLEGLAPETVVVVISNGERRAADAWKHLRVRGVVGSYILAGGLNQWLDVYGEQTEPRPTAVEAAVIVTDAPEEDPLRAAEPFRYTFPVAIGERGSAAWPDPRHLPEREYTPKVKSLGPVTLASGGCG